MQFWRYPCYIQSIVLFEYVKKRSSEASKSQWSGYAKCACWSYVKPAPVRTYLWRCFYFYPFFICEFGLKSVGFRSRCSLRRACCEAQYVDPSLVHNASDRFNDTSWPLQSSLLMQSGPKLSPAQTISHTTQHCPTFPIRHKTQPIRC